MSPPADATAAPPNTRPYAYHLSEQRGNIQGLTHFSPEDPNKELCHSFQGIPYALPPVGPFRWTKPRPLPPCYGYGTRKNPGVFTGGAGICPQPTRKGALRPKTWDEDCLQLNVWVPAGKPPKQGWPVLVFYHGGFLQFGSPNDLDCQDLMAQDGFGCIIVCPAYRVGVLGFLSGRELADENGKSGGAAGSWGFWDQRLALEWTWKNISYFDGDSSNITVGGYSAGAHSAFHQLCHDLLVSRTHIIRRVLMLSNSPGLQPQTVKDAQKQMDLLCSQLGVSLQLPSAEKLARLRAVPVEKLMAVTNNTASFPPHEFKSVSDDAFIPKDLFTQIDAGTLASRMRARGVELLIGENAAERHVYGTWRPPRIGGLEGLRRRLEADYAPRIVHALLDQVHAPGERLPQRTPHCDTDCAGWPEAFGAVYADVQVHALQRGFVAALERGGAGALVRRYRIEWRAGCARALAPPAWGATHGADLAIWFFGMDKGGGLTEPEKAVVRRWCSPVWAWLRGELQFASVGHGEWEGGASGGVRQVRRLKADGAVDVWADEDWERGCMAWRVAREASEMEPTRTEISAKL